MTVSATATYAVEFVRSGRSQERPTTSPGRTPRVARTLALAHEIERRIRDGEFADLAAAARAYGITRARITQIVNLTLLAPAIQAEILAWPSIEHGRDPVTERTLRPIVAEPVWHEQMALWRSICSHGGS